MVLFVYYLILGVERESAGQCVARKVSDADIVLWSIDVELMSGFSISSGLVDAKQFMEVNGDFVEVVVGGEKPAVIQFYLPFRC